MTRLALLALMGCSEYDVVFKDDQAPPVETDLPACDPCVDSADSEPQPQDEVCDGVDNDLDGFVDETSPDSDGDGVVDCLDQDCDPEGLPEEEVEVPFDPWAFVPEWSWATNVMVANAPVAGQLNDDNGDGVVDEQDIPELLITTGGPGSVIAFSGDGTGALWSVTATRSTVTPAVADIDNDGENEVVVLMSSGYVSAIGPTGSVEWTSAEPIGTASGSNNTVADLDGDGLVEVISQDLVLNGADGSLRFRLSPSTGAIGWNSYAIGDIDDDGDQEILFAHAAFDSDGAELWSIPVWGIDGRSNQYWALFQGDSDPEAEIVFVQGQYNTGLELRFLDHEGNTLYLEEISGASIGGPCVADFDGDGDSEIVVSSGDALHLYEADGTRVWTATAADYTGSAHCSAFDFNADGAAELLFGDNTMRLIDGATGTELASDTNYNTVSIIEYPTIGDFDGDGSAEIASAWNSSNGSGLVIYGHPERYYADAGRAWPVHDYTASRIDQLGQVLASPTPSWQGLGLHHSRPALSDAHLYPNLRPALGGACVASCEDGRAELAWAVINDGPADAPAGTPVSVYAIEQSSERLLFTVTLPEVPSGWQVPMEDLPIPPEAWARGVVLRVDDDGAGGTTLMETHEDDNAAGYGESLCGEATE
ncbi:MAG: VCBS repeat-containing protein [Alphaproteobacteria bacterium]|nr:VCBS repeat-containing protein [Alphaproteobacteria bacterium]